MTPVDAIEAGTLVKEPCRQPCFFAEIAQLAERNLPMVEGASSRLAFRSIIEAPLVARAGVE